MLCITLSRSKSFHVAKLVRPCTGLRRTIKSQALKNDVNQVYMGVDDVCWTSELALPWHQVQDHPEVTAEDTSTSTHKPPITDVTTCRCLDCHRARDWAWTECSVTEPGLSVPWLNWDWGWVRETPESSSGGFRSWPETPRHQTLPWSPVNGHEPP